MPKRGVFAKVIQGGTMKPFVSGHVIASLDETSTDFTMNALLYNDRMSSQVFDEVYNTIAKSIITKTNVTSGIAIDLGCGPGNLGIALAKNSNLTITAIDPLQECLDIARENIIMQKITDKMSALKGTADNIEFPDSSVDLVVSRGSIFFWKDHAKALLEINRVLKPGAWAYIGGGFGSEELLEKVHFFYKDTNQRIIERKEQMKNYPPYYKYLLESLSINGNVETGGGGMWLIFRKTIPTAI